MEYIGKLRVLAWWYRKLAERAPDTETRDSRRRTAELFEIQATYTESEFVEPSVEPPRPIDPS
jgi:hypothetical protein